MTMLQTIRPPTLLTLPFYTRLKGQGPKAKPAGMTQDIGHSLHATRKDRALSVLKSGIYRLHVGDGMPANFQIRILKIRQTRQIATTMTICFLKIDLNMLQKTQENPLQQLQ